MTTPRARRKILFFAEAVTLAHVGRPLALAACLDAAGFELVLACDPRANWALGDFPGQVVPIHSIPSARFLRALAVGRPLYDEATLSDYVDEDLKVLREVAPDVVVGDFRLSLSVSARIAGVRYIAVSNAYWSPYYRRARYVVPDHPATRFVPVPIASAFFRAARRIVFAIHSRPLNRVRKRHGLPPLGGDLRRVYTDADEVCYADVPELFPLEGAPAGHRFLGPVVWSPPVPRPEWWERLADDRPVVYVTLGSSGRPELLDEVLASLAELEVTVIAATASDRTIGVRPANAHVAKYLPGEDAARRAALVICNGGSPTSQQALAAGVPVVGVASNLDQFLNMQAIEAAGAGILVRSDRASTARIRRAVQAALGDPSRKAAASRVAGYLARLQARERFRSLVGEP